MTIEKPIKYQLPNYIVDSNISQKVNRKEYTVDNILYLLVNKYSLANDYIYINFK